MRSATTSELVRVKMAEAAIQRARAELMLSVDLMTRTSLEEERMGYLDEDVMALEQRLDELQSRVSAYFELVAKREGRIE